MQAPEKPRDEEERVAALHSLQILDTPAEERFDRYTRLAKRLFDVPIALVSLVDRERQWFKSRQGLEATETPRDVSFCGHAILDSGVFCVPDAHEDPRFADNPLVTGAPHVRFYAGYPLAGPGGYRLGTLCIIDHRPRVMAPDDIRAFADIASMVAGELSALRLATTDELTGLSNRRGFMVLAAKALALCGRADKEATLVTFDLDDFKPINDTYGHAAGDEVLRAFADLLVTSVRESDVVGRLGGDEFCALLCGTSKQTANVALERLRDAVRRRNASRGEPYRLAFSAGVAECETSGEGLVAALGAADAAMYEQKQSRDRSAPDPGADGE